MGGGKRIAGPIRDNNPCKDCTERFTACSDRCPKDDRGEYGRKAYKAEIERVNKNRSEYLRQVGIGIHKKH